jgi:hypothetical protein
MSPKRLHPVLWALTFVCSQYGTCFLSTCGCDNNLRGTPLGSRKKPNAGRSPTCRLWTADANSQMPYHTMPMPCCAVALRSRFHNGVVVEWHGRGMACVNQTRPHCVNKMGKTQTKPLAARYGRERHGMCELALSARPRIMVESSTETHS